MIPNHSKRRNKPIMSGEAAELSNASDVKTTTTHNRMMANERATRSRKLNDSAYSNNENAVMAIPAVRISLTVLIPTNKSFNQPLSIQTFRTATEWSDQKIALYPVSRNTGHYNRRTRNPVFVQAEWQDHFSRAFQATPGDLYVALPK